MTRKVRAIGFAFAAILLASVLWGQNQKKAGSTMTTEKGTVEGLVRDIACPIQNSESTSTTYSEDCVRQCAKAGSPLGILTADGTVYTPLTESMPDTGQEKLKPFVGKQVRATGKLFERNGAHGIEIAEIQELPKAK